MIQIASRRIGDDAAEIAVEGDLDAVASGELRRVLEETRAARVELDLSCVAFLDCAGARSLLRADARVRERGGRLVVMRPSAPVVRLLRLLSFDRYLSIEGVVGAGRTPPGD
ncbi:STAS domain-containing protein [Planomonospora venezuelensis]|uniref:Anti-anti-sigma factor n=1 Tax=Planomonospora venezuelensis TaxID=1999 RepID=A0A841DD75_PLAVE|nr:anti-anti-sigma factor [Planomonospora venezuelensis]GIN03944.1 hypothetical protein Pve01_56020 [Planomonospora venezuelensis]